MNRMTRITIWWGQPRYCGRPLIAANDNAPLEVELEILRRKLRALGIDD
jgi:hypothetical protein